MSTLKSLVSYELQEVSGKCDSSIKYVVDLKEKLNVGTKCSKQEYEKTDVNDSDLCSLPSWSERECKYNKISEEKNSYLSKVVALHIIPRTFLPLKTFFFVSVFMVDVYFHHFQVLVDRNGLDCILTKIYP